ncbi:MAG TPA: FtsX-like permease family protein, partial [Candidatus Limnocylindria bacterium]
LATAALALLNAAGPLADVGLSIEPRVTSAAYLAAAAAGIVCVALMVVPVLIGARRFAETERELSRQETRTFGQRMGLDMALIAISGIALWQLRSYGATLTTSVRGSLGVDPLLVAAPAIGLLAGGIVALRIMPLLAGAAEGALSRGRDLVTSLGVQQLARRPLRYTRSVLLLMIAISTGVFALSYAATWSTSQHDQADFQSGAAVRAVPGHQVGALPPWALPAAYAGLPGVGSLSPVERRTDGLAFGASSGDVLAIDADVAPDIVLMRPDQAAESLADLMRPLRAGRPQPRLAELPAGTTALRVVPWLDIVTAGRFVPSGPFEFRTERIDPATITGVQVSVGVTLRDARGLLYQLESAQQPLTSPAQPILVSLGAAASEDAPAMAGPLEVAELSVDFWLPADVVVSNGSVGAARVSAGQGPGGPWQPVALSAIGPWRATQVAPGQQESVAADLSQGITLPLSGGGAQGTLFGNGTGGPPAHVVLVPKAIESLPGEVPVIANHAFLLAADAGVGDSVAVRLDGLQRTVTIAGSVEEFPGTDGGRPVLIVDEPTLGLLRLQATNTTRDADEWWFAAADAAAPQLAAALAAPPFASSAVLTAADRERTLGRDPVAVGILGALALGFVAAALFAIVGLVVSAAVSARQRQTEFAVLRALGLSGGQLSRWLWLENGSVVAVSVVGGTALGLLIGWLVLPFVTVTQRGTAPVPAVIVEIPWERILILDVSGALVLAVAVAVIGSLLRRRGVGSTMRMGDD